MGERRGMGIIYNEFKTSALSQLAASQPAATQSDLSGSNPSALTFSPDVHTFNIMLGEIDPKTFLLENATAEGMNTDTQTKSPSDQDSSLTPSESAALAQVTSLLSDMGSFSLMPDENTFKLVLKIMS